MIKLTITFLFMLFFVSTYAESIPEFDGGYIKTQKNKVVELTEITPTKTKISGNDNLRGRVYFTKKSYLGFFEVSFVTDDFYEGYEIETSNFKGIVIKGTYNFKELSLSRLVGLTRKDIYSFQNEDKLLGDGKSPIKAGQTFYVPSKKEISLRKKSLDDTSYYFQPKEELKSGAYVLWDKNKFWIFKITNTKKVIPTKENKKSGKLLKETKSIFINVISNYGEFGSITYKLKNESLKLDLNEDEYEWYIDGIRIEKEICSDFHCAPNNKLLVSDVYMENPKLSGCSMNIIKFEKLTRLLIDSNICN